MLHKVGCCGRRTWGGRGWAATASCGGVGPTTSPLLLKPSQPLWAGLVEAALAWLESPKPPQGRWRCLAVVGARVEATGGTKDHAKWHGLRKGKKLAGSKWMGRGGESCEEHVRGHSRVLKTFRSRNAVCHR